MPYYVPLGHSMYHTTCHIMYHSIYQASLGFAVDPSVPMFLFMGRLDGQKGVDILFEAIKEALQANTPKP
jgi:glycosyltransferase involved in cell wall biosynthesis